MDPERVRELYVSNDPADHAPGYNFKRDIDDRVAAEARYAKASQGVMDFQKVTYRSSVGDMDIPAYLFQPLKKRGPNGHAAIVWVHGGVHGNWGVNMFPFVKGAVERGYVVICPDYRGSTGYGEAHHNAIDYGGLEIDDTLSAVDYLKRLPHVDQDRFGITGRSHGGYITLLTGVGHTFNRRVNMTTLEGDDSPDQRDSWNRTWTFFEWHLQPYEDRSQK